MNTTSIKFRIVRPYIDRIETLQFEANIMEKHVSYTLLKTFTENENGVIKSYKDKPIEIKHKDIPDNEVNKLLEFIKDIDYNSLTKEEIKNDGTNGEESVVFSMTSIDPIAEYYKEIDLNCKPSEWTWAEKLYNYINMVYNYNKKKKTFWKVEKA